MLGSRNQPLAFAHLRAILQVMPLHMTKIAFGCESLAYLRERFRQREDGGAFGLTTRYRPKRAEEMVGGSLYWILGHMLVARSPILGFEDSADGRTLIMLDPRLVPVTPQPKRAHQGWRYLADKDAPDDLHDWDAANTAIPAAMARELAKLGL